MENEKTGSQDGTNSSSTWYSIFNSPFSIKVILYGVLPFLILVTHFHVLDTELMGNHAWRQCETASTIQNYYEGGMDFIHPRVNHLDYPDGLKRIEFPLFQYVGAVTYQIFGDDIVVLRLYCLLISLLSVFGMHRLATAVFESPKAGLVAAWTLAWSPLYYYYVVNPLPDVMALCFGIWSMAFFVEWTKNRRTTALVLSAVMLSLSTLCKLPFITFISLPLGFLIWQGVKFKQWQVKPALLYLLSTGVATSWYIAFFDEWKSNGIVSGVTRGGNDLAELAYILYDTIMPTTPELILNYAATGFFVVGTWLLFKNNTRNHSLWPGFACLAAGVTAYFTYEMNMIGVSHAYYLFPFLPGLFLILTYGANHWLNASQKWVRIVGLILLLILPVTASLRINHNWDLSRQKMQRAVIQHKKELQKAVPEGAKCIVGNDNSPHIYLYHLHKKGWSLSSDGIQQKRLQKWLKQGAEYFYCDDRNMETHAIIAPVLGLKMATIGAFNVWQINNPYLNKIVLEQ